MGNIKLGDYVWLIESGWHSMPANQIGLVTEVVGELGCSVSVAADWDRSLFFNTSELKAMSDLTKLEKAIYDVVE